MLVKIFSQFVGCLLFCWQYPLPYRNSVVLWGPICQFLILEQKLLVFGWGKFPLCPSPQGSSPVYFLLVSVCLVLCGGSRYTWTWASYKEIRMGHFALLFMLTSSWTSAFVEKIIFSPLDGCSSFVKDQVTIILWVHFQFFNSIPLIFFPVTVPILRIFNTIALQYSLRSGILIPPNSLLLLG